MRKRTRFWSACTVVCGHCPSGYSCVCL